MIRIGHAGAAALAPANTLRSIELALELDVDLVELDVIALADGTLVLGHSGRLRELSHGAARGRLGVRSLGELRELAPDLPTLDEALALVQASEAGVQLDLKQPGYERPVLDAVRRRGLVGRTLVSSGHAASLRLVGELEPAVRRGLTYPFDRHGIGGRPYPRPAVRAALAPLRLALPRRLPAMLARAGDPPVAALHFAVVSAAAVRRCRERGVEVLAWTVDDLRVIRRLARLGVNGIVTNDPRVFAVPFAR